MNQKLKFILISVVIVLVFVGIYMLYHHLGDQYVHSQLATTPNEKETAENSSDAATDNSKAPDFTVYDAEGNSVRLSDFLGKPVIVNFWASWCGPCKSEMPDFQTAYEKYGDQIVFLMVNMTDGSQETVQTASAFIEKTGYTFPVYFDSDSDAAITYGVRSIPTTYFIDALGNGIAWASGAINESMLEQGIDMIKQP